MVVGFQNKFLCWVHVKVDFFIQMLRKIGRNSSSIRLWMGINQRVEWVSPFFVLLPILEVCNAVLLIDASLSFVLSYSAISLFLCQMPLYGWFKAKASFKLCDPPNAVVFFIFFWESYFSSNPFPRIWIDEWFFTFAVKKYTKNIYLDFWNTPALSPISIWIWMYYMYTFVMLA